MASGLVGMSVTVDGNDGGTKSGRLVTNDGHQRRNNRPHAGDKLWGFHKNSAYGFLNRITPTPLAQRLSTTDQHALPRVPRFGEKKKALRREYLEQHAVEKADTRRTENSERLSDDGCCNPW